MTLKILITADFCKVIKLLSYFTQSRKVRKEKIRKEMQRFYFYLCESLCPLWLIIFLLLSY